jgi:hypothetical protein
MKLLEDRHGLICRSDLDILLLRDKIAVEEYQKEFYHQDCEDCHEHKVLDLLKCWYWEVFHSQDQCSYLILPDGSTRPGLTFAPISLVVYGYPGSGKTRWFESICDFSPEMMIRLKYGFSTQEIKRAPLASLLLIDEFLYPCPKKDFENLRSLLSAESINLSGKLYSVQVPCVLLTNNSKLFQRLKKDEKLGDKSKFIDLQTISIAPLIRPGEGNRFAQMQDAI